MKLKVTRKEAMPYLLELEGMARRLPKEFFGPFDLRKMCKRIRKATDPVTYDWEISTPAIANRGRNLPAVDNETVVSIHVTKKYLMIDICPWIIRQSRCLGQSRRSGIPVSKCLGEFEKWMPESQSISIASMIYMIALTISVYDTSRKNLIRMQDGAERLVGKAQAKTSPLLTTSLNPWRGEEFPNHTLLNIWNVPICGTSSETVEIGMYDMKGILDMKNGSIEIILSHEHISQEHLIKLNNILDAGEIHLRMWGTRLASNIHAALANTLSDVQYLNIESNIKLDQTNDGPKSVAELDIMIQFRHFYPTAEELVMMHTLWASAAISETITTAFQKLVEDPSELTGNAVDRDIARDVDKELLDVDTDSDDDVSDEIPEFVPESPNPTMPLTVKIERYDTETTRLCWNVAISMGPDFVEIPHAKSYDIKSQRNYFMRKMAVLKTKPDLSNNRHAPFIENLNTAVEKCTDFYPSFKVEFGRTTCVVDSDPGEGVLKSVQISFDIYVNIEEPDYTKYANKVIRNINMSIPNLKKMVVEALMPSKQS